MAFSTPFLKPGAPRTTPKGPHARPESLSLPISLAGRRALSPYARSRMFATVWAYHLPPRAVGIPRAFSASQSASACAHRLSGPRG